MGGERSGIPRTLGQLPSLFPGIKPQLWLPSMLAVSLQNQRLDLMSTFRSDLYPGGELRLASLLRDKGMSQNANMLIYNEQYSN